MKAIKTTMMLILMAGMWSGLKAQDCEAIVKPYLDANHIDREVYVQEKFEWRCHFSYNSFFIVQTLPEGAPVYEITELTSYVDGSHPAANIAIDLNTFSYWAYDFVKFQVPHHPGTIYFRTTNPKNPYLGVRGYDDAYDRTYRPENYQNEK